MYVEGRGSMITWVLLLASRILWSVEAPKAPDWSRKVHCSAVTKCYSCVRPCNILDQGEWVLLWEFTIGGDTD